MTSTLKLRFTPPPLPLYFHLVSYLLTPPPLSPIHTRPPTPNPMSLISLFNIREYLVQRYRINCQKIQKDFQYSLR